MIAGAVSEITGNIVKNPFEVIKNQMQVGHDKSLLQTIVANYRANGLIGFYSGYRSAISRDIGYTAINMPIYEYLKRGYLKVSRSESVRKTLLSIYLARYKCKGISHMWIYLWSNCFILNNAIRCY